jgi:2-amino-4-hydroxy-6-hydroxymethyldihydropteridine diphosphokinase
VSRSVAETGRRPVVLALGSNLGDRLANLQLGVEVLDGDGITATAVSGVFETAPVGGPQQDNYLNAVLLAVSALPARQILARCAAAESAAARVRTVHWGPRTLDVDIISCDDERCAAPDLTLPHPRAHERAFVLAPWLDVEPAAVLPGRGLVADLLAATSMTGVWRRPELRLTLADGHRAPPEGSNRGDAGVTSCI